MVRWIWIYNPSSQNWVFSQLLNVSSNVQGGHRCQWLSFLLETEGPLCSGPVYFDGIWCVTTRLWTHPAPVTPITLAITHQVPPLLCLGRHLWKPEWGWRIVSGVILGNETYKVSVIRENVFLIFLILCHDSWAAQIQSKPLQVTPPHALSLGSMPFWTVSLNCPSAWNLLQRWEILDYLTSSGNCYKNKKQWLFRVCRVCFSCVLSEFLPAAAAPCMGPLLIGVKEFCPTPCCHHLMGPTPMSGEQEMVLARNGSGYRCHFPHLHLCCYSASHSNRALFYPYGLCPLGGRWQWFKNYSIFLHQGRFSCEVSFGDACHNHLIFFQSMKLHYFSRSGEKVYLP